MPKDYIGYEALADRALRIVVREALKHAEQRGLLGNHHFYLTFKTHDPGVEIPEFLRERFPDEMTIVLQNQYWGLKAGEDAFEVTVSFQKIPAPLVVPYAALTAFADPGVPFGLQFRNATAARTARESEASGTAASPDPGEKTTDGAATDSANSDPQVVSLDKFRKK